MRASQSSWMTVSALPPGFGRISKLGCGEALLPVSPPITRTDPFARTAAAVSEVSRKPYGKQTHALGYQRCLCRASSWKFSCQSFVPFTPAEPFGVYKRTPLVESSDQPPTFKILPPLSGRTTLPEQKTSDLTCISRQALPKSWTRLRSSS